MSEMDELKEEYDWIKKNKGFIGYRLKDVDNRGLALVLKAYASRGRHQLSVVPSEEWLEKQLNKLDKAGRDESYLQAYSDAYYDLAEEIKRGIAG